MVSHLRSTIQAHACVVAGTSKMGAAGGELHFDSLAFINLYSVISKYPHMPSLMSIKDKLDFYCRKIDDAFDFVRVCLSKWYFYWELKLVLLPFPHLLTFPEVWLLEQGYGECVSQYHAPYCIFFFNVRHLYAFHFRLQFSRAKMHASFMKMHRKKHMWHINSMFFKIKFSAKVFFSFFYSSTFHCIYMWCTNVTGKQPYYCFSIFTEVLPVLLLFSLDHCTKVSTSVICSQVHLI